MARRFSLVPLSALLLVFGCRRAPAPTMPPPPVADYVRLVSVTPISDTVMERGRPVRFDVVFEYSLSSRSDALLSLSIAQFRNPRACSLYRNELVAANEVPIHRGTGTLHLSITWPGDTGVGTKDRIYGYGSLSFFSIFWGGHLTDAFYKQSLADQYCSHF